MRRFIQKAYRGQMGAYLQFFVLLLLVSATLLVALAISGCDDCDESTFAEKENISEHHSPAVVGPGSVPPGGTVGLQVIPSMGVGERTITWTPPPGATNFEFPGAQPQPGGPPFMFSGVDEFNDVRMSYTAPPGEVILVDTFASTYADGSSSAVSQDTIVTENAPLASPHAQAARRLVPARPLAEVEAWAVNTWIDSRGITLTTELCQEWVTKLQGDEYFLAARMPMTTTAITGSYRLPFVFGTPYSQTLFLERVGPLQTILTATLEYRPERLNFLANELPSAAGERWAALGIAATEPVSCPEGLNVPLDSWHLKAELLLDLHDQPGACEGCTVQVYYCYEGQESPLESLGQRALARTLGMESYQGQGITCLGPKPIHLEPYGSGLRLGGASAGAITPTLPITLHEHLNGPAGSIVTLTMDYASTVEGWLFYDGDWVAPDLGAPITTATEIVVPASQFRHIWAINSPVPTDTLAGPHSLVITVTSTTSPSLATWDAIPLWSGEWVAPPPPSGTKYRVYLPLVVKSP